MKCVQTLLLTFDFHFHKAFFSSFHFQYVGVFTVKVYFLQKAQRCVCFFSSIHPVCIFYLENTVHLYSRFLCMHSYLGLPLFHKYTYCFPLIPFDLPLGGFLPSNCFMLMLVFLCFCIQYNLSVICKVCLSWKVIISSLLMITLLGQVFLVGHF